MAKEVVVSRRMYSLQLPNEQLSRLRQRAGEEGKTVAQLIRDYAETGLTVERELGDRYGELKILPYGLVHRARYYVRLGILAERVNQDPNGQLKINEDRSIHVQWTNEKGQVVSEVIPFL